MKVDWKKLAKQIPIEVTISSGIVFKILWVDSFPGKVVGEMDLNTQQIRLSLDQTDKEKVMTYLHEVCHALSDYNDIKLTETQVSMLEKKCFYYLLKKGNVFNGPS